MDNDLVILVDEHDCERGVMNKMEAHRAGILHRALSVFIFNSQGQMLLQQRAFNKYHSGGLWSNTCCSHPAPGEDVLVAAERRLREEMGFDTSLTKIFEFTYKTTFTNDLIENEFDHVFVGIYDGEIAPDESEVNEYSFRSMSDISTDLKERPEKFTFWFHLAFPKVDHWWKERFSEK